MNSQIVRTMVAALFLFTGTRLSASGIPDCQATPLPRGSFYVSSPFGMRLHPISNTWRMHWGVDLATPAGTPVHAVGDGLVLFAGRAGCYGNAVILLHSGDTVTLYAHLSQMAVLRGWRVRKGDVVGAVGATGCATGNHLHFELWLGRERVNPLLKCDALHAAKEDSSWHRS